MRRNSILNTIGWRGMLSSESILQDKPGQNSANGIDFGVYPLPYLSTALDKSPIIALYFLWSEVCLTGDINCFSTPPGILLSQQVRSLQLLNDCLDQNK